MWGHAQDYAKKTKKNTHTHKKKKKHFKFATWRRARGQEVSCDYQGTGRCNQEWCRRSCGWCRWRSGSPGNLQGAADATWGSVERKQGSSSVETLWAGVAGGGWSIVSQLICLINISIIIIMIIVVWLSMKSTVRLCSPVRAAVLRLSSRWKH